MRTDGRNKDQIRSIKITKDFMPNADGSCLIEVGNTKVIVSATIEDMVPSFMKGQGKGWITAEYGMIPCSCNQRITREAAKGKVQGRTQEYKDL